MIPIPKVKLFQWSDLQNTLMVVALIESGGANHNVTNEWSKSGTVDNSWHHTRSRDINRFSPPLKVLEVLATSVAPFNVNLTSPNYICLSRRQTRLKDLMGETIRADQTIIPFKLDISHRHMRWCLSTFLRNTSFFWLQTKHYCALQVKTQGMSLLSATLATTKDMNLFIRQISK